MIVNLEPFEVQFQGRIPRYDELGIVRTYVLSHRPYYPDASGFRVEVKWKDADQFETLNYDRNVTHPAEYDIDTIYSEEWLTLANP